MADDCLLVGDIGGTNARFALAGRSPGSYSGVRTYACADFLSVSDAIRTYLGETGAGKPRAICIAAAGPVVDGTVRFTNNPWRIDVRDLAAEFGCKRVRLLNDFEAIAYGVPWLAADDLFAIGDLPAVRLDSGDFTVAIVGPGTGLGAAGLCRRGAALIPIVGEGGHLGFAPETRLQMEVHAQLRTRFDRVSDERLVSGPGLRNIHWALAGIRGEKAAALEPAEIFEAATVAGDALAVEAVQLFYEILGQVAGNLVLAIGAFDGAYIAGGIAQRNPEIVAGSRFRSGFEMKGRHRPLMEKTPTSLIMHVNPGLIGASYVAMSEATQTDRGRRHAGRAGSVAKRPRDKGSKAS